MNCARGGTDGAEGAVAWTIDNNESQARTVNVVCAQRNDLGRVFIGGYSLALSDGKVIHGNNIDGYHRDVAVAAAVENTIGKAIGPVEVRGRYVRKRAIGIQCEGQSVAWPAHKRGRRAGC